MFKIIERPLEAIVGLYALLVGSLFIFNDEVLLSPVYTHWRSTGQHTWGVVLVFIAMVHFYALWLNGANPRVSRPVRLVAVFMHLCVSLNFAWFFHMGGADWGALTFGVLMPGLLIIIARRVMDALLGKGIKHGA